MLKHFPLSINKKRVFLSSLYLIIMSPVIIIAGISSLVAFFSILVLTEVGIKIFEITEPKRYTIRDLVVEMEIERKNRLEPENS